MKIMLKTGISKFGSRKNVVLNFFALRYTFGFPTMKFCLSF